MSENLSWVRAQITIDIAVSGPWGPKATNEQMINDAKRAANNIITELVGQDRHDIRRHGDPVFKVVTVFPGDPK